MRQCDIDASAHAAFMAGLALSFIVQSRLALKPKVNTSNATADPILCGYIIASE
ncbi:hypothetical protein VST7929_02285 [Vibrio stylophorae]|uniref:Uncharacterized protein n=1 Tax=Vibrio stylophorae TaxID=659351 RepID=A0ABN8DTF5_9VIBR|nr:hypothetical protein VST7929_02285 [Vibrio stylophorae]